MGISKWQKSPLKLLCHKIGDGLHGTPQYDEKSEFFFINGNNLKNGNICIFEDTKKVSSDDYENNYIELNEKSLLFSINGTIGGMAFYNDEKVMLGKSAAYLNFKTEINQFYYYYFQLKGVQQYFYNVATGSTIKNLGLKSIQDFEVPSPNAEDWLPIAKVLSNLDKKIELNNKINAELEAMAKLIYDYWFVQFDFPDTNGKPYKSSGGKMVYNEELKREIPNGWDDGSLNDVGEIVGGSTPSTKALENFTKIGTPWITPKDLSMNIGNKFITRGGMDVSDKGIRSASLKIYPKNTVLMSSRAPIGYMAIARGRLTTNQGFKSFLPNKGFSSDFIFYTVKNSMKSIVQYSSGSTFKEVSGAVLKTVKVCLPKTEVAGLYSKKIESIFNRQNLLEIENTKLTELRDWLLPMLMNGQVTVKDLS